MLYLLDANVLIRANKDYYPLDRIPQFWDWLISEAEAGRIKMPFEIHKEISDGNDTLKDWVTTRSIKDVLVLEEKVNKKKLNQVIDEAYAPDLNDNELEQIGYDPFLIAYGMAGFDRVVVTKEVSRPGKKRGKRKVPNACDIMEVPWMTDFKLYEERNFRI